MSSPLETDVLIVGAGPAGMVAALCLAELGVESVVVERYAQVNPHPKAHELNARSIEILEELGVSLEELETEAAPAADGSRILFCRTITEEFGRIDLLEEERCAAKYRQHVRSQRPYLNLSQTELERIVRRHVEEHPRIRLLLEHQWESHTEGDAHVQSVVRPLRESEGAFEVRSRYLIGSDGAGSRVRTACDIEMVGPEKIQDFVNAYFEIGLRDYVPTPAKLYWIFHPAAPGAFIAHHVDKRWTYNVPVREPYETFEDFTEEVLRQRIQIGLGTDEHDIEIKSISHWRMTVQVASAYRRGRVFLVGDSAHRFPPTGGLGMNTGIADAHNLCWKLAAVLNDTASEPLLDTYEAERKPVAERNADESRKNFDRIFEVLEAFGVPRNAPDVVARITANPLIKRMPSFVQRLLLRVLQLPAHLMFDRFWRSERVRDRVRSSIAEQVGHFDRIGLDIGYVYGRGAVAAENDASTQRDQRVTEYEPTTTPGARFPHVPLNGVSNGRSSHDLLRYDRYTLLVGAAGAEWKTALQGLRGGVRTPVEPISLDEVDVGPGSGRLETVCEIDEDGALLVRPDGHVAWRQKRMGSDPKNALREAFEQLGVQ